MTRPPDHRSRPGTGPGLGTTGPSPGPRSSHDDMRCAARGLAAAIERSDPDAAADVDFWQERLRLLVRS